MDYWLLILVFVAIVIGWSLGRWQFFNSKSKNQQPDRFSESYAKGLNYLLAEDSDNAIKVFTDLIKITPDTIEVHIALGNLFRTKGEVDRAIKVHQNLLARPDLTKQQRHMAISELASDYLKAGLFDRAEMLYREMIELKADARHAHLRLLDLYIAEKSWLEAMESARALHKMGEPEANITYSQCLCEVANEALEQGNNRLARQSLDHALEIDPNSVRASLLLIQLHVQTENLAQGKRILERLIRQHSEYMALYIEPARQIYLPADKAKYQEFLLEQNRLHPSTRLAVALLEHYARNEEVEKAHQFLTDTLRKTPSFEAFEFALRFVKSNPDQLGDTWESLTHFLQSLRSRKSEYNCSRCGYESHSIQWQCPSCRNWASMKPV